jgi:hypothetical protein
LHEYPNDEDLSPETPVEPPGRTGPVRNIRLALSGRFPPYLVLLRVGFTLTPALTGRAVRSYRTISPLPRH